ncbi:hypothetical protein [Edaphobacillus lindanitolerans]|uniref:DUF4064 domain-containing protein n=1 Tax=Edaphobacillus lindanitolerans TaxID=550447 RepID=A0A1U7PSY6_9BACI|nr:hypothetical protein [Edaphobacillus lindanitolerans]SIT91046.1 hypothetical protein SAMN05428946_2575 [Edaphobacillus lindanitolerans]
MNRLSVYAMVFGTLGILFFILSGISAGWNRGVAVPGGPPPLTTMEVTLFYTFSGAGLLCFIVSIIQGILGFKNKTGNRLVRYSGLLFIPILIIGSLFFGLIIALSL